MERKKYYVGLDIGTDSVGYAVTDERYELCKFKGEAMWGVNLFDEAKTSEQRRSFRTARRRLDRRQQRVQLLMELFAEEICSKDPYFFKRIKESYLYPETEDDKVRLFDTYEAQKEYVTKYPTIHHLIVELMNSEQYHDPRLVFLASAWLVAHRGHFLSEVDKHNIDAVTDFDGVYQQLVSFIQRDGEYALPWNEETDIEAVANALKGNVGITKKSKALTEALFGNAKAPKSVNEQYEYNYECVIKLLSGGQASLKDLFGKEEYAQLEEKSIALNMDDERLAGIMQSIGDDAALISVLKSVYDWSVLVDILKGKTTLSEAKVEIYKQHEKDLKLLKYFVKKYANEKYNEIFRSLGVNGNYVDYIGKNKESNEKDSRKNKIKAKREDFCKYILSVLKSVTPNEEDVQEFEEMCLRLKNSDFMPKQVDGDNRVITYQLYWFELNKLLKNAENYIPFLSTSDEDGITGTEKILSVFEFRVPYFCWTVKARG